jgi:hypothetical protein
MDKKQKNAEYFRKWYAANKEVQQQKIKDRKARIRDEVKKYKESNPCMDCGIFYKHYVMDFDHRDGEQKEHNVSNVVHNGSIKKVWDEIAKCDLVCSNCHRERTNLRLNN